MKQDVDKQCYSQFKKSLSDAPLYAECVKSRIS